MREPSHSAVSRRAFLARTGAVAGATVLGTRSQAGAQPRLEPLDHIPEGLPRRVLGRTKVPVTTFTLGTAACGSLPPAEIADLVNYALDQGVNSVDTSGQYQNAQEGVGLALGRRRNDVFLATKVFANSIPEAEASLEKSIRLLKTDSFDLLYYHSLGNLNIEGAMEPDGVFTWLLKQKKAGKCRFVGISGHHLPGRFQQFLETGEVDVLLAAVNFVDRHTYDFENRVLPLARKHDVGIVAMKVYGGMAGMNYRKPAPAQLDAKHVPMAFRYALSLPGVATSNIGVHSVEEIRHNVQMAKDFEPLSEAEHADLLEQGKPLAADWGAHFGAVEEQAKTG